MPLVHIEQRGLSCYVAGFEANVEPDLYQCIVDCKPHLMRYIALNHPEFFAQLRPIDGHNLYSSTSGDYIDLWLELLNEAAMKSGLDEEGGLGSC
ncbi:CUN043 hypothetical protein [Culex nigripalpus nucleopolyhedrovirus]|uniref:Uncharacterized protein n=2 Tax=Deltabaculovirus TaxID=558019 RepID=Q77GU7_NPVCO|nr:CUN043 hypothetical protein [Culex nigripalpus nucleopolyhedrovirus]AAK13273.1 unknown [Culex nigripalpus nucleopolyhedrovirus]AAK94121.1 CUN043 hypothetical protein [Culex nigripalpus nucleopolyhedrovirus]